MRKNRLQQPVTYYYRRDERKMNDREDSKMAMIVTYDTLVLTSGEGDEVMGPTWHESCHSSIYPQPLLRWPPCRCRGRWVARPSTAACPSVSCLHQTPGGDDSAYMYMFFVYVWFIFPRTGKTTMTTKCPWLISGEPGALRVGENSRKESLGNFTMT